MAEKLKIIPLGGLNEIGKNMTVLEYGKDMIVVDCGLGFPEDDMYGVDLVIPDVTYLAKNQKKLRGFFITHGHEDHIGALPYVLQAVNAPVHATPLTLGLIKLKLEEHDLVSKTQLVTHHPGDVVKAGCFSVEFIHVNHSIADAVAFAIHTPVGTVIMTGDFKIDPTSEDGMTDLGRFGMLGKEGVYALLCDSTNVERQGYTPSESVVSESLDRHFKGCKNRIIVTTFASNMHRIQAVFNIAHRHGRKVAVTGRSMENILKVATELDYLHLPENTLVDLNQIKSIPKDKLVIFCVHIPLRNATSFNRETVRNLLKEFDNVHIMAGHTHYAQNYIDGDVYEHIHGAVCGAWWKSTINVDGTPNGYGVYDISGSKIENWYYKPTRLSKDFQIRMYRGETTFAGGYKFTYTASDEIVANIWNSDDRNWKVEVYENGNKTGEMTREKSLDAWGAGYHVGVLSANPDSHGKTTYDHFYHYKLKDAKAAVEIRATDCFGKVYTQNVFTTAAETDYPMVDNYPAVAE